jgi:hypothetical protein
VSRLDVPRIGLKVNGVLTLALLGLVLTGCSPDDRDRPPVDSVASDVPAAFSDDAMAELTLLCDLPRERSNLTKIEIAANGRSMSLFAYPGPGSVDSNGQKSAFFIEHVRCILEELGAPASVWQKISNTQTGDGELQDDWDGFSMEWQVTSSPLGLEVSFSQTD